MKPALPPVSPGVFIAQRPIRFAHCDPAGIVFFPRYFEILNGVVEDWLAHIGCPWTDLIDQRRIGTPTVQIDTTFFIPSRMGETLDFHVSVHNIGRTSLQLKHRIQGPDGQERLRCVQWLVATSLDTHRSIPWPDDVRRAITHFKEPQHEPPDHPA